MRRGDELAGHFYLDPYARPAEKKGGAWMNGAVGRSRALASKEEGGSVRLPVAILCCNQSPPVVDADGKVTPSLMTFDNVTTLFHETGHGLQHLLTTVDEGAVAGISGVEWDAVEQPSQFMEYWVEQRDVLSGMAKHWQTGEQMPDELVAKIRAAKTYRAASAMVRQLEFAMTDLALHDEAFTPGGKLSIFDAHKQVHLGQISGAKFGRSRRTSAPSRSGGGDDVPSAVPPREPLPLRVLAHLRRRVRGGVLLVQVGGGPLSRRFRRVRGGGPRGQAQRREPRPQVRGDRARDGRVAPGVGRVQALPRPRAERRCAPPP